MLTSKEIKQLIRLMRQLHAVLIASIANAEGRARKEAENERVTRAIELAKHTPPVRLKKKLWNQLKKQYRYQVVVKGSGHSRSRNFSSKKEATTFIKQCKKQGKKTQLWHIEGFGTTKFISYLISE